MTTQGYPHHHQQSNSVVASSSGKPGKENKEMLQAQELLNSVFAAYALSVGDIERGCRKVETIHYRHLSLSTITITHPFTPIFLSLLFLPPLPTTPPSLLTTPPSQALNELMICERMAKNLALLTASGDPEGGGNPTQSVVYNQSVQCLMTKFGELEVFKLWAELQLIELRATLQEVKNRQFPVGSGHLLQASGGCFSHNPLSYLLSHILTYHVFLAYPLTYPLSYTLSHTLFYLESGEFGISVQLLSETQSRLADMKRRMKTLRTRCDGLNLAFAPQVPSTQFDPFPHTL